ncbi:putative molybdenum carrier protein [Sunxiuqinia dokdonensis]|uniref:Molybdenum cofactor carrier n=1 Tax=Sunxiuqinia dokdonensis TaxID=1409788 RepID=A0A0L8V2Y8_9BACT|nr:putative molybdenum carrier protein [Sunxiuqinia dokdonensis]KOH42865.1 hypothetical protein NC99_43080 [Sunxiuqinia dokdonensis]
MKLRKIVSGGQTGVDRAALDACLKVGFPCGGWCPAGRRAEDGAISDWYPLQETDSIYYDDRTRQNIIDSHATLIIYQHDLTGGTLLTFRLAQELHKPVFLFKVSPFFIDESLDELLQFLTAHSVEILNVAGPRASQWAKAYESALLVTSRLVKNIGLPE